MKHPPTKAQIELWFAAKQALETLQALPSKNEMVRAALTRLAAAVDNMRTTK